MASQPQTIVEPTPTKYAPGSPSTQRLQKLFPASPIYNGELTDDKIKQQFEEIVLSGIRNTGFGLDGFNTAFVGADKPLAGAPDLADVKTGGGGLPATPYVPNPVSPGPGSTNASDQAAAPDDFAAAANTQYGSGVGHALQPSVSSENIQKTGQKLGDYVMGKATKE
jgi:hypothetical protein